MDRLRALSIFKAVVDAGSFTAAASALDLAKPIVTRSIRDLEGELGVQLLRRTTRRMSLTPIGESILERAGALLDSYDEILSIGRSAATEPSGLVRLFAPMALGCRYLGAPLAAFRARYPKVVVDLQLRDGPLGGAGEDPDVALCFEGELRDSHVGRPLMRAEVGAFAAPALLSRNGEPRHPFELGLTDCLTLGSTRGASEWSFTHAASGESHTVAVKSVLNASHIEVLIDAAMHATGIAMLPVGLVSELSAQGGLRRILAEWESAAPVLYITYRSRRNQPMAVVKLIDHLTEAMLTPRTRPQEAPLRLLKRGADHSALAA